ncbi:DUF1345 domain-containing protein [Achromobacter sp. MFA1 R4]|uniref:DUF1345 domain-containing protein n=1 Tax=Achromobacter sp. MFA1 R4 TaxID=1881016 RepID=UPI00095387E8|nr:DUF1345 domain-containing protein [Achromobacter sp. MFA1 R4]SIT07708.1 Uncharacterized membrane protein [Achromobacter sp. MFA1 R4]
MQPPKDDRVRDHEARNHTARHHNARQARTPDADTRDASLPDRLPFLHAHRRLMLCAGLLLAVTAVLDAAGLPPSLSILLGFDAGALVFLVLTARVFARTSPAQMRLHARQHDVGRSGVLWSSVALSCMVLVALWVELRAQGSGGAVVDMLAAAVTIVLSWLYMNMIYALHYAHGYYGHDSAMHKGLDFPGTQDPDYWDFAYFSVVLGMTFQVSDVQIVNRRVRRLAMTHGVIAFFFNVFIIAISVNVAAGRA